VSVHLALFWLHNNNTFFTSLIPFVPYYTLSDNIIEAIFKTYSPVWQSFEQVQIINNFDDISFDKIVRLVGQLETEIFSEFSERNTMLNAYLSQLFVSLHRLISQNQDLKNDDLAMDYFRRFQRNIKKAEFPKSIPDFAADLNITPVHLNRICKAVVGKSSIELVNQHLVSEAQKYLTHTSYSVSEIAYLLRFEYPNYFAKLFKKLTGLSPVSFREQQRK
jgi:AraC family transcriptional regulator, transcriptional activator of pobA